MRIFFLVLAGCLVLAGLTSLAGGRDSLAGEPAYLAGGSDGNGPDGPPSDPPGEDNATRPEGTEQSPAWAGQDNATRPPREGRPGPWDGPGGRPASPPPGLAGGGMDRSVLTQACSGKSAGDECSFEGPRGEQVSGQCRQDPRGSELQCWPRRK